MEEQGIFCGPLVEPERVQALDAARGNFVDVDLIHTDRTGSKHRQIPCPCRGFEHLITRLEICHPVGDVGIGWRGRELLEAVGLFRAHGLRRQHGAEVCKNAYYGHRSITIVVSRLEPVGVIIEGIEVESHLQGIIQVIRGIRAACPCPFEYVIGHCLQIAQGEWFTDRCTEMRRYLFGEGQ